MDILIAGIAIANGVGVATRNIDHFSRIDGLYVEDWTL
jgi:tRNA(fMet)-specific endonuclease VapC